MLDGGLLYKRVAGWDLREKVLDVCSTGAVIIASKAVHPKAIGRFRVENHAQGAIGLAVAGTACIDPWSVDIASEFASELAFALNAVGNAVMIHDLLSCIIFVIFVPDVFIFVRFDHERRLKKVIQCGSTMSRTDARHAFGQTQCGIL